MSEWAMKRFWTEARGVAAEGGWSVTLDGRPVKTPAKAPLLVPSQDLAEALASEWNAQDTQIDPATMPLTRLANSAIDKVSGQHAEVAALIADYAGCDMLCYRAEHPAGLIAQQAKVWDPYLHWADKTHGLRFALQEGVMPVAQPEASLRAAAQFTYALDAFALTAFHDLVTLTGSWVLGRASFERAFDLDAIWEAANLDALWQERDWGVDEEAAELRATKRQAFGVAEQFGRLARTG